MEFITDTLLPLAAIISMIVTVVIGIRKPNENQDVRITKLESSNCDIAGHIEEIKKSIAESSKVLQLFKENEFRHLESDMQNIKIQMTEVITIMKERLPSRTNGFKKE